MLKKILIVDDDPTQCGLYKRWIKEKMGAQGIDADCAGSLEKARARVHLNNISVILLDLTLSDSPDPCQTAKFIAEVAPIPVIVISGSFDAAILSECLRLGAKDFYEKGPGIPEKLIEMLGLVLQKHYPESNAAQVVVETRRSAAAKHFWEFPLSEGFGAKLAVLLSFVTLLGMAWTLITVSYGGVHDYSKTLEQQGRDKLIDDQAKALAKVTATTVEQHTEQFRSIGASVKEIAYQLGEISQTQSEEKKAVSDLRDDVLKGKQERTDIKEALRDLHEDARTMKGGR